MRDFLLDLRHEPVALLADGALLRLHDRTLYLADLHWGKAAAFRAAQVPVPFGTTDDTLTRLDRVIARVEPERLVILGDLWHARSGRHPRTIEQLERWRHRHAALPITLVRGNHDQHAGDPSDRMQIHCVDGPLRDGSLVLRHHPVVTDNVASDDFWLAGHVHPAVEVTGFPRERLVLPCFHLTRHGMVLPAFGAFTGKGLISHRPGDRVFVVADDEVHEMTR